MVPSLARSGGNSGASGKGKGIKQTNEGKPEDTAQVCHVAGLLKDTAARLMPARQAGKSFLHRS